MPTDRRLAASLAVFTCVLYLGFHHGSFKSTDESGIYEVTRSLYRLGELWVPPGPHVWVGRDGNRYNHFAVGQSVLALPLYGTGAVARAVLPRTWLTALNGPTRHPRERGQITRVEVFFVALWGPIVSAGLIGLFYLFERRLGASRRASIVASLVLATGSYVATMSAYFLRHTSEAVLVVGALYALHVWQAERRRGFLLLGCTLASLLLWIRVPASVAGPGLAAYLAYGLTRVYETQGPRDWLRAFARESPRILGPFALAIAGHVAINQIKWGTWFASPMTLQSSLFTTPLGEGLAGFLVSPGASVFLYSPPLIIACVAWRHWFRCERASALAALGISLSFLFFCARFEVWSGLYSAPGPRYLFVATPLLMLGVGPWLVQTGRLGRGALATGFLLGAGVQALLLLGRWPAVIANMGYLQFEPQLGFLFDPAMSPLVGYLRAVSAGEFDPWLIKLALGWPGFAGQPLIATGLAVAWLAALAGTARPILRALRPETT